MQDNEIQKDDLTLPGGIGTVKVGDQVKEITAIVSDKKLGACAITIHPIQKLINGQWVEDAEFEIIQPKPLPPSK